MKRILFLALFLCVQAQAIWAQTPTEFLARAKASIQAGKAEAAVGDLNEAIKAEPSNAEIFATRAHAYIKLGNYAASLSDSSRATELSPNFGWAYYLHGIASYWQTNKDFRGASADFTKVIALDPQLAFEAYRFRADIHNQFDKDYWAAIADANEAIRLKPADGNSYAQRAWANTQLKNYEKARDDYRMSVKYGFATSGVYTALGFNEFQLADYDQAAIDSRKALELDPNNQDAKNNLASIIAAKEENTKSPAVLADLVKKANQSRGDDPALIALNKDLDELRKRAALKDAEKPKDDDGFTEKEMKALEAWAKKDYKSADDERCRTASFTTSTAPLFKDEKLIGPPAIATIIKSCDAAIRSDGSAPSRNFYTRAQARYYLVRGYNAPLGKTLSAVESVSADDLRLALADLQTYLRWTDPDNKGSIYDLRKMANIMAGELTAVAAYKEKKPALLLVALKKLEAAQGFQSDSLLDSGIGPGKNDTLNGVIARDRSLIEGVLKKNGVKF